MKLNLMQGCFVLLALLPRIEAPEVLSGAEFELILSLRKFFNIDFVVLIEDEGVHFHLVSEMKSLSENNVASVCMTPKQLESTLATRNREFWKRKMMLTTKKAIRLETFLKLVRYHKLVVWVLFEEPSDAITVGDDIPYNGEVLGVKREGDRLVVYEMLHTWRKGELLTRTFGYIDLESDVVHFPYPHQHARHKMNLSNAVLRNERCGKTKDGYMVDMIACYHFEISDIMVEMLNFRHVPVIFNGTKDMFVYPNGSYSGFFKQILDREADISVAPFAISEKRLRDFDFIWPTFAVKTKLYVKKADAVKAALKGTPFSSTVWLTICAWSIVMGSFLFITKVFHRRNDIRRGKMQMMCNSVLKIVQLTCNQGSSDESSFPSYRLVHTSAILGGMLFNFYYSAMVLSYLTVENVEVPFSDFKSFMRRGDYKLISIADGFPLYFLNFELLRFGYEKTHMLSSDQLPTGIEEGIEQLCDGKQLTLLETQGTLLSIDFAKCELLEIPSPVFDEIFGFATVDNLPFSKYFTLILRRLFELGIREKMNRNLSKFDTIKALHVDEGYNTVSIEQIIHDLYILKTGIGLSVLILIMEIWIHFANKRRKTYRPKSRVGNTTKAGIYFLK